MEKLYREMSFKALDKELNNISNAYKIIYDKYYENNNRECAFLKDLVDSLIGISSVLEVYVRDGRINSDYVIEKLNNSKRYIDSCIEFYKGVSNE